MRVPLSIRTAFHFTILMLPLVTSQSINALTAVLSICNHTASISPTNLSSLLLTQQFPDDNANYTLQGMFKDCSHEQASFNTYIVPEVVHIPCDHHLSHLTDINPCPFSEWADYVDSYVYRNTKHYKTSPHSHIPASYKYHIYVLPNVPTCHFGGMGTVAPCIPHCRVWIKGSVANQLAVYFHELGHNLGLSHAWYKNYEYGDLSDAMGECCNRRCFNAPHSQALNWTTPTIDLKPKRYSHVTKLILLLPNQYIHMHDGEGAIFIQFRKRDAPLALPLPLSFANVVPVLSIPDDITQIEDFKTVYIANTTTQECKNNAIPENILPMLEENDYKFFDCVNIYRSYKYNGIRSSLDSILCKKDEQWVNDDKSITITLTNITDTYAKVYVSRPFLK